eukprot:TRINITY_DN1243_c0_g1_i1.p1 TRINITY_DN1243_c0_g1~~TRINITY_DN1243_c0_g1_i1.p1  ORF type:complete len:529 (+),score=70.21 TRINITY_DN1243_c0_g1_i1:175-1761(+)
METDPKSATEAKPSSQTESQPADAPKPSVEKGKQPVSNVPPATNPTARNLIKIAESAPLIDEAVSAAIASITRSQGAPPTRKFMLKPRAKPLTKPTANPPVDAEEVAKSASASLSLPAISSNPTNTTNIGRAEDVDAVGVEKIEGEVNKECVKEEKKAAMKRERPSEEADSQDSKRKKVERDEIVEAIIGSDTGKSEPAAESSMKLEESKDKGEEVNLEAAKAVDVPKENIIRAEPMQEKIKVEKEHKDQFRVKDSQNAEIDKAHSEEKAEEKQNIDKSKDVVDTSVEPSKHDEPNVQSQQQVEDMANTTRQLPKEDAKAVAPTSEHIVIDNSTEKNAPKEGPQKDTLQDNKLSDQAKESAISMEEFKKAELISEQPESTANKAALSEKEPAKPMEDTIPAVASDKQAETEEAKGEQETRAVKTPQAKTTFEEFMKQSLSRQGLLEKYGANLDSDTLMEVSRLCPSRNCQSRLSCRLWIVGIRKKCEEPKLSTKKSCNSFYSLTYFSYLHSLGAVSYTHLTLPTNREV